MNKNGIILNDGCRHGVGRRDFLTRTAGLFLLLGSFFLQGNAAADDNAFSGALLVYSRTEQIQWGEGSYFYPHTAYWIYDRDGKKVKTVENHGSAIDETPERVELKPGIYTVKAWSDNDGLVVVRVVIQQAQVARVYLENGSR